MCGCLFGNPFVRLGLQGSGSVELLLIALVNKVLGNGPCRCATNQIQNEIYEMQSQICKAMTHLIRLEVIGGLPRTFESIGDPRNMLDLRSPISMAIWPEDKGVLVGWVYN